MEINQEPNTPNTPPSNGTYEVKFPQYPLIGRYPFGSGIVEIYEKEYDDTNPYEVMPYLSITDDGVAQVFFEKGTFTDEENEDLPQFRCFPDEITTHRLLGYAEGPFKRLLIEYPYGYYNSPKRRIEYRFRMRINPDQVMFYQGPYKSLTGVEKRMCRRKEDPFESWDQKGIKLNFRELLEDFSQMSIQDKRKVFCGHKYKLHKYVMARLRGNAKSEQLSVQRKLSKHYSAGKFLYNHITREVDQVKPLNKTELADAEKDANQVKARVEVKDIPYILPVGYSRLHPIAKKFSIVKGEGNDPKSKKIDWSLYQGTWMPPKLYPDKKKSRVKFQQLPVDPNNPSVKQRQIRIYDPNSPEYKEYKAKQQKQAAAKSTHPLGRLLKSRLDKGQNPDQNK